jgi:L-alanine-DL-glutamate epimerase-like enolase superfamily enzyme
MLIDRVDTALVEVPLRAPIGTAIHTIHSVGCVLVEVHTTDGAVGQSLAFTINADRLRAFDEMIRGLAPFAIGRGVDETAGIWEAIWLAINPTGHKGVTISALSTIDVACWDAFGRTVGLPLHRVFGACRSDVDTYASSGLWLTASIDELVVEATTFVEQGFHAVKLRIGNDRPDDDVARVRAIRQAVGDDIGVLVDANQKFTPKQAIVLGRRLEEFSPIWIEEPVAAGDLRGHAEVRASLATPIASGETEYTRFGMQAMIDARAADVLMPDLQRIGGYTEFRRAAAAAAANHLPVSSHFFTEHSLALAGSLPNLISVEHVDWFAPLFVEQVELRAGKLVVPERPGTGFTFDQAAADKWALR